MLLAQFLLSVVAVGASFEVKPGPDALSKVQSQVRDYIRTNREKAHKQGIEIVLGDGVYRLERPLSFTEADCGVEGVPVVWRAANRGRAILSGAAAIEPVAIDWEAVPASLILPDVRRTVRAYRIVGEEAIPGWRNGWRQTQLNETPVQVHINGERCRVATWPRTEYARTGQPVSPIRDSYNEWGENWYASFGGDFRVSGISQLGAWAKEPDLWAFGMWRFEWSATTSPVLKVDPVNEIMCVDTNQNAYGFLPNAPFNVFNAFSEIRRHGDWAIDRKARVLYVCQRDGDQVEVSIQPHLVAGFSSVHDIVFQDLVFQHSRKQAALFYDARRVTIRASLFRGIGDTAVVFGKDSRNCVMHGCDLYDLGKGGVSLSGGDQKSLTAASNVVENCHIHHYGRVQPIAQPAINMSGVGNRAKHNLIHHFAHQGIVYIGNDHYCGFNILHDGVQYNNDAGMIYCGSYDWSRRGSVCEYNCIFMAGKQPLSSHVQGIYMDGWTSGVIVRGNIVNRASLGIYMSGGNDNVVVDNITVNCQRGINLSSLGADSFAKGAALQGKDSFLYKKLLAGRELYETPLWRKRYPRLLDLLAIQDPKEAHNAYWYVCTNNVMCATQPLRVANAGKVLKTHHMEGNIELPGDPGFIDYEGFNWELKADAPARKALPNGTRFAEMGLYPSPWRFSPPVKHGEGMSKPRPIRTEFDQGCVVISVIGPKGARWRDLSTATPEWREYVYEEKVPTDGDYRVALIGGGGYKTMYDDVRITGAGHRCASDGSFESEDNGWTWYRKEMPSTSGELGTPHGIVRSDEAFDGKFVALANDGNPVTSKPMTLKKGDTLRVLLRAKLYVPDFIRPYWDGK